MVLDIVSKTLLFFKIHQNHTMQTTVLPTLFSCLLIDILAAKILAINALVKPELELHPLSTTRAVWWLPKQLTQKFIQLYITDHFHRSPAKHMHDSYIITSQDHVLLVYCISPEMCQAEVAHYKLKWRHVWGVSGPLMGQDHLDKTTEDLSFCMSINTDTFFLKTSAVKLVPGAQTVLLLTEKVASIIQHITDTAPLMLNSKTMRSWSALSADMRSNDAYKSFLNDKIFNEGIAYEISSIKKLTAHFLRTLQSKRSLF